MELNKIKKDYLTGCYLREGLDDALRDFETECKSTQRNFSVMILDIDHFKSFNDKHGHLFGDDTLKYFAESLRTNLDDFQNIPFRFGGDEFVVIFPDKSSKETYPLAVRLKDNIKLRPFIAKGCAVNMSFCAGVASYPEDGLTWQEVFEKADRAMYFAKRSGRGRIMEYRSMGIEKALWLVTSAAVVVIICMTLFFNFGNTVGHYFSAVFQASPKKEIPIAAPISTTVSTVVPLAVIVEPKAIPPPAGTKSIYLVSGGVIRGVIEEELQDVITVRVAIAGGSGKIKLSKKDITRIEAEQA